MKIADHWIVSGSGVGAGFGDTFAIPGTVAGANLTHTLTRVDIKAGNQANAVVPVTIQLPGGAFIWLGELVYTATTGPDQVTWEGILTHWHTTFDFILQLGTAGGFGQNLTAAYTYTVEGFSTPTTPANLGSGGIFRPRVP